ncbi:MAG: DUF2243 domain-containing protein [bacterium]
MSERTDTLANGALIALGAAAVLDNVFSHWLLGLHRVVPGDAATPLEVALLVLGLVLLAVGVRPELGARNRLARSRHRMSRGRLR